MNNPVECRSRYWRHSSGVCECLCVCVCVCVSSLQTAGVASNKQTKCLHAFYSIYIYTGAGQIIRIS